MKNFLNISLKNAVLVFFIIVFAVIIFLTVFLIFVRNLKKI